MVIIASILIIILVFKLLFDNQFFLDTGVDSKIISGILALKLIAAGVLYCIYTITYPDRTLADIFKYYDDGLILFRTISDSPYLFFKTILGGSPSELHATFSEMKTWFTSAYVSNVLVNDSRNIVRLNAFLNFFSLGSYGLQAFYFCLIGFYGQLLIFKSFNKLFPGISKILLILIVTVLPSVTIWSSGVLKEAILFLGLGLFIYTITHPLKPAKKVVLIIISGLLLLSTKYYIIPCIAISMVPLLFSSKNKILFLIKSFSALLIIAIVTLNIHWIFPKINIPMMLMKKHNDFYIHSLFMDANNISYIGHYDKELGSFLLHLPKAFLNTLVQPFITDIKHLNISIVIALIENILYLLLPLITLILKPIRFNPRIHFPMAIFIILFYTMIGMTTPVIGSIVRYKAPVLAFYCIFWLSMIDLNKVNSFFKSLENKLT